MQNVTMTVRDGKLVIEIDLTKRFGTSSTGKSIAVASTQGNVPIPEYPEIKVGINVYTPVNR